MRDNDPANTYTIDDSIKAIGKYRIAEKAKRKEWKKKLCEGDVVSLLGFMGGRSEVVFIRWSSDLKNAFIRYQHGVVCGKKFRVRAERISCKRVQHGEQQT